MVQQLDLHMMCATIQFDAIVFDRGHQAPSLQAPSIVFSVCCHLFAFDVPKGASLVLNHCKFMRNVVNE
jgi:hypothetical protein